MKMLKNAYAEAKRLLSENRDAMDQIAAFLIEKETITGKEFMKIFRQVKGIPEPEEGRAVWEASSRRTRRASRYRLLRLWRPRRSRIRSSRTKYG